MFPDFEPEQVVRCCFDNSHSDVHRQGNTVPSFHFAVRTASAIGMEDGKGNVISRCARLKRQRGQQGLDGLATERLPRNPGKRGDVLTASPYAAVLIEDY